MMPRSQRKHSSRYLVAIGVTLLALFVRIGWGNWVGASSPFLFFAPAVMIAAWYGGLGPGAMSTLVGAMLANYFLLEPLGTFSFTSDNSSRMLVFLIVGMQISWLSGAMRQAQHRAESDAQAARRSEKLYRTLAANFPDGFVCLFDSELRWTLVAGAGLDAAKLTREAMEGRKIAESLPPETGAIVESMCGDAVAGRATQREITHLDRVYACHALPLRTQDEPTHIGMIILEDITERARAREALQWAHDTLEQRVRDRTAELHFQKSLLESQSQASADAILAAAEDGSVIFANRRFNDMWRVLPRERLRNVAELREAMRGRLQSRQPDPLSTDRDELTITTPEGSQELIFDDGRAVERYSAPIIDPDGRSYGRVWFFRDITERKRLQREILEAGERERQRIGQDLHDDLCQELTGIACLGEALYQQLSGGKDGATISSNAALEIVERVQHANQRARELAQGLQPVNLQRHGLVAALEDLCRSIHDTFRIPCVYCGREDRINVDEAVGVQMFRISQEAISNAARHAKAKRVMIDLIAAHDRLILTIEDDGTGIPQPLPQTGMGLFTMSYRAKLIGGSLTVERRQPHGTLVTCTVPVRSSVEEVRSSSITT